jgi:hypothetical protein
LEIRPFVVMVNRSVARRVSNNRYDMRHLANDKTIGIDLKIWKFLPSNSFREEKQIISIFY